MYKKKIILFLFILFCKSTLSAAVNDVIPGDYQAPAIGVNLVTLYLAEKKMAGPYVDGEKLTDDGLTSFVTALKYTATIDVGGYTVCPMIALPYSNTQSDTQAIASVIGKESVGIGDTIIGATAWFINEKQSNQYLAATLLFFTPTGAYDSAQLLNIGENRYKSTLNIGYIQKLSDDFIIELSPEVAVYGENDNSLERVIQQDPSYAFSTNLRYQQTHSLTLFTGLQQNFEGETHINGESQNDVTNTKKGMFGAYYYTDGGTQILLKYCKEFGTENGMQITNSLLLRFQWWFI